MKYSLTAVIPVVAYGNLQPTVEVEAETFAEAHAIAMSHIETVWAQYGEKPLPNAQSSQNESNDGYIKLTSPFGGHAWFNEAEHVYKDDNGKILLSGSVFAKQYSTEFNKDLIIPKMVKKWNVDGQEIEELWQAKADTSALFGSAVHKALETYGKHKDTANKVEKPLVIHPLIQPVVEAFFKGRESEKALYEPFITDGERVGQIDRLVITGKDSVIIEDYKTNVDIDKKIDKLKGIFSHLPPTTVSQYALQLNFYREILERRGYKVEAMKIHHLTNGWKEIPVPRINLTTGEIEDGRSN